MAEEKETAGVDSSQRGTVQASGDGIGSEIAGNKEPSDWRTAAASSEDLGGGGGELRADVGGENGRTGGGHEEGKGKGEKTASYVIEMSWDGGEKVCRICHLSCEGGLMEAAAAVAPGVTVTSMELIQLGCGCKDELGVAHSHCGETWFKLKGNRVCEICGETAKNITGVADNASFMEEWNQMRLIHGGGANLSSERGGGGCWRGQPFCNFLMACLVIAFVLPWFFRVNMF